MFSWCRGPPAPPLPTPNCDNPKTLNPKTILFQVHNGIISCISISWQGERSVLKVGDEVEQRKFEGHTYYLKAPRTIWGLLGEGLGFGG